MCFLCLFLKPYLLRPLDCFYFFPVSHFLTLKFCWVTVSKYRQRPLFLCLGVQAVRAAVMTPCLCLKKKKKHKALWLSVATRGCSAPLEALTWNGLPTSGFAPGFLPVLSCPLPSATVGHSPIGGSFALLASRTFLLQHCFQELCGGESWFPVFWFFFVFASILYEK